MASPLHIEIFLSSPGDVAEERRIAKNELTNIVSGPLFKGRLTVELVAYDDSAAPTPMVATASPQDSVLRFNTPPSKCQFTILILWSRLGTPTVASDGAAFASGTVSEFEEAVAAGKDVYVYVRSDERMLGSRATEAEFSERRSQQALVDDFVKKIAGPRQDKSLKGGINNYYGLEDSKEAGRADADRPPGFRSVFRKTMEAVLAEQLKHAAAADDFCIYLADAADDLRTTRNQLAEELQQTDGVRLLRAMPPPWGKKEHTSAVQQEIGRADLCVHLLGIAAGALTTWDPQVTYPAEQARLALAAAKPQLFLHPPEAKVAALAEGPYRTLRAQIEEAPGDLQRIERQYVSPSSMLDAILAKRDKIFEAKVPVVSLSQVACISLRTNDLGVVSDLVRHLQQRDVSPLLNPRDEIEGPRQIFELLTSRLGSKFFIIVCRGVRVWAYALAQEAYKLAQDYRLRPQIGVYVAPGSEPESVAPTIVREKLCTVIDNTRGFDPGPIDEFLGT